ncbi:MAG: NADP-dependent phosphogluconate dehydrogenase [Ferruginibacter sp.]
MLYNIGIIGLGTMGYNLAQNMIDKGFTVAGCDKSAEKVNNTNGQQSREKYLANTNSQLFVQSLELPRKIILLVPAGKIVDDVLNELLPFLSKADIVIDAGNSHFTDTLRRVQSLQKNELHFMGMGVSGGEEGARFGPSIMPGGNVDAWKALQPILEAISAKVNGEPCVAYMGKDAAGHYVKMVHNGIEYAIMQLIAETYDLLKNGCGYSNEDLEKLYTGWNDGMLQSFLMEITAEVFKKKDDTGNALLLDMVLDKAKQKGTGKWTSQDAMDVQVPIPTIDAAVIARDISAYKDERIALSKIYSGNRQPTAWHKEEAGNIVQNALLCAVIISYAQGLSLLATASTELKMEIPLKDVVKIWRGGCIIRSVLLKNFYTAFEKDPALVNLLFDETVASLLKENMNGLRQLVSEASLKGFPVAAFSASLGYIDAFSSERLPVNLIQAQRDFFGAHTYERIDREGIFHTQW